ncbi:hypothetical protein BO82DRAFT_422660 [Aspergillus uvarum CBS 121591]|uniref:Uncharacterized protein n=1 Tax=Aspergillus uvarum CBS 121591 TaxID=1448315 RepID=A0A319CNV4_9EURO|nr:hypothetical protein BO82DRAFT_422660 [Aspergillus uvarum CBS 121591]PYH85741.1 hypothetical protein BO82DRAFT_422660 [Aspergillus uvarum CBS 121591]
MAVMTMCWSTSAGGGGRGRLHAVNAGGESQWQKEHRRIGEILDVVILAETPLADILIILVLALLRKKIQRLGQRGDRALVGFQVTLGLVA